MGEGKTGVNAKPEEIEREVEQIRGNLDPVLKELDVRRHELTDWRLQLRRHGPKLARVGAGIAGVIAAVQVVKRFRKRRRERSHARRMAQFPA